MTSWLATFIAMSRPRSSSTSASDRSRPAVTPAEVRSLPSRTWIESGSTIARGYAAYPRAIVDPDSIHVRDGKLRTSAGVTAGLDLSLALVEEDLGRDIAMKVASQLVMFFKRPGGQMQFSRKGET